MPSAFKICWRSNLAGEQHPVPDVLAFRVVEHFDVIEHVLPGFLACFIGAAPDALTLERGEEAFSHRAVMAVAAPAHRVLKILSSDEGRPVHAGELRARDALLRVKQRFGFA